MAQRLKRLGLQGIVCAALGWSAAGCSEDSNADAAAPVGLATVTSTSSATDTGTALATAIMGNAMVALALDVNHETNATGASLTLPPSRVFIFGNPMLGTPLMVEDPLAGLDLPLKMLAYQDSQGAALVAYDSPAYLQRRYGLTTVDAQLTMASNALANFASAATGTTVMPSLGDASGLAEGEGLLRTASTNDAQTTFDQLMAAITASGMLTVARVVDHQANAMGVGLTLGFNRVIIFGNPNVGTPLIQASATMGLDLPLKMLVVETPAVWIVHNDPTFLARKHGSLDGEATRLGMVATTLQNLANQAAAAPAATP